MDGARPTRTRTWGVMSSLLEPINPATISRLAGISVIWVSVQVARPTIVASSSTAESISPQRSTLGRVVVRRQHRDLGMVFVDFGSALAMMGHRESTSDVDAVALGRRYQ